MEFCPECGNVAVKGAKFCHSCGTKLGSSDRFSQSSQASDEQALMELPMPPGMRIEGTEAAVGLQGEDIIFSTTSPVLIDGKKWSAHITNHNLILKRSVSLAFSKETRREIEPAAINWIALNEEGSFLKEYNLQIDALTLKGRKSDLLNLYRSLQSMRSHARGLLA